MHFPRLQRAIQRQPRHCLGMLSGTSMDAAEAVICRIAGTGDSVALEVVAHVSEPFTAELKTRVLTAATAAELSDLNFELGEVFAKAALAVIAKAAMKPEDIDVIGSHGQTLSHLPPSSGRRASTLQLGEPSVIAERTGIPVVYDFRTRDLAAGGHGAPLVPYADWALFRRRGGGGRALLNIGGIANISAVFEKPEDTLAFDTGPGNMLLDALAGQVSLGTMSFDRDGTLSSQGSVITELLDELVQHPYIQANPPKSTGREEFGQTFAAALWIRYKDSPHDLLATVAAFTVESVALGVERYLVPKHALDGLYVSGGGSRNPTLMRGLASRLAPLSVRSLADLGFPEEAKEAACFALLASECLSGTAANLPKVTGAAHPVILGKIVP